MPEPAPYPLLRLWRHAVHHRRRIIAAAACSVANKTFDLAPPALIGMAVDIAVRRERSLLADFGIADAQKQLVVLAVLTFRQRQRLSIARAVLAEAPILVLDEATSSVDNETEAVIQRSLERLAHSRTTIVIAHRLSTVRHADKICVLERGRLAEEGTHDELVRSDGTYATLWRVQTGEAAG